MFLISTLARRLWTGIRLLGDPILAHQRRHPATLAVLNLVWLRMLRILGRFERLTLTWERDRLPAPRVRASRPSTVRTPAVRLPTANGWLVKLLGDGFTAPGHLAYLLDDPETRALVAAAPQAGRLLRPLCRMLGVAPPAWLALPKRPRKPRPARAPQPTRRRMRPVSFTRAQIDRMTAAELTAIYGRMPPHFNLPIPNFNYIRRKIAAG